MASANFKFHDNSGQVVVGNDNNLQMFKYEITHHGGSLTILPPEQAPRVTARPTPIDLRPRFFQNLFGRKAELEQIVTALERSQSIELYGVTGIGKSVLLRHLAYHPITKSRKLFPDGVIYFDLHRQEPVEDIQQRLFDTFYDSEPYFKPSTIRVRHDLQSKRALIILDNASLSRNEVEKLWGISPNCVYVFSSLERNLYEGHPVHVEGISQDSALALIEKELGRPLTAREQAAAKAICTSLNGHPLEILQQILGVRENTEGLGDVANRVQKTTSQKNRIEQLLKPIDKQKRSILAALTSLEGIALTANQVFKIADVRDAKADLAILEEMHLIQQEDSRYCLSMNLLDAVRPIENLTPYRERAISSFTEWAQYANPGEFGQASEVISYLLQWSVEQKRWNDVLLLGKPFESALAVLGQWGAQAQVLQWQLQAARELENQSSIAYAQHQLGTRALCLGYIESAQNLLNQAVKLREAIGETVQASASRNNARLPSYLKEINKQKEKATPISIAPDYTQEPEVGRRTGSNPIQPEAPANRRPTRSQGLDIGKLLWIVSVIAGLVVSLLQIWKFVSPPTSSPIPSPTQSREVSPTPPVDGSTSFPTPSIPTSIKNPFISERFEGNWVGETAQGEKISFQVVPSPNGEAVIKLSVSYQFESSCPIGRVTFKSLEDAHIFESGNSYSFLGLKSESSIASIKGAFDSNKTASGNLTVNDFRDPGERLDRPCPSSKTITWSATKQ